jgi:thiamine kinase-like enzyme
VRAGRAKYEAFPHFPRAISERALDLALELSRRPEIFRAPFQRSPETLLHGDYHRGNLLVRRGEPQVAFDWQFVCAGPPAYDLAVFWLYMGAVNKRGFFGFFDRLQLMERPMSWRQVLDTYTAALRERCPDADIDAIVACSDEALAWEAIRQVTYFGHGLDNFGGYMRFIYRDHRTIGGWFANWIGITEAWRMYADVFADFEERAERLLSR